MLARLLLPLACLLLAALTSTPVLAQTPRTLCVFDPIGKSGDVFVTAEDLSSDFLSTGVSFNLKLYLDEKQAKRDFKTGKCDGVILTGLHAREFNRFSAALEAPGSFTNYANVGAILELISSEKAAQYMRQGNVEVAGVYPAGFIYMIVNQRSTARPDKLRGQRMIIVDNDPQLLSLAERVGALSVPGTTDNFGKLFKDRKVDITFAPMAVLRAMELDKAIEYEGGIVNKPVSLLTLQFLINTDRFPEGFGQQARTLSVEHFERVLGISQEAEANVPRALWIDARQARAAWMRLALAVRAEMVQRGLFHPQMIKIIDHFRCGGNGVLEGC